MEYAKFSSAKAMKVRIKHAERITDHKKARTKYQRTNKSVRTLKLERLNVIL